MKFSQQTLVICVLLVTHPVKSQDKSGQDGKEKSPISSDPAFSSMDNPFRYVRGVYEVPDTPTSLPVIYDSYFPLIYEFHLPKWDAHSMKIQFWKDHNNCTESDRLDTGYPCPVMFYMNQLIEDFAGNMTIWRNLFVPKSSSLGNQTRISPYLPSSSEEIDDPWPSLIFSSSTSHIQNAEYYCSRISPHFSTFQTTPERMQEYYDLMNNCGNETVKKTVYLNGTAVKLEDIYHTTFSSFAGDYWEHLPDMTRKAMSVSMWSTLQTTLMLHQFMETQKWSQAISNCQKGQIPWTLIDHKSFTDSIRNSSHYNEHLAIPPEEISKYYNLPLTDCVFVGDDTLVVRILIPLVYFNLNSYRIIRFEPVVFHEDGEFCWYDGIRDKRFIADHQDDLYLTDCSDQEQKLCKTSDKYHSSQDKADSCVLSLHADWEPEIVKHCFLKCIPVEDKKSQYPHFDLFYITEDNYIFATADNAMELKIECEGKPKQIVPKIDYGAWNITLPCNCKITGFDQEMEYPVHPPCGQNLVVEKIRPYHWRNMSIPKVKFADGDKLGKVVQDQTTEFLQSNQPDNPSVQLALIWVLLVSLIATVGVLVVVVHKLYQWRQQEAFRENRLIYNVNGGDDVCLDSNRY